MLLTCGALRSGASGLHGRTTLVVMRRCQSLARHRPACGPLAGATWRPSLAPSRAVTSRDFASLRADWKTHPENVEVFVFDEEGQFEKQSLSIRELRKDHGINFRRNFYVPLDSAHATCQVHKVKNTVQAWAGLASGESDAVIDIDVLRSVAAELKAENRAKYGCILAALEKHTDMQSQAALVYVILCREFQDRLYEKGHIKEYAILLALSLAWLAYDMPKLGDQRTRTFYIEVVQQLLMYNIVGDRAYMPGGEGRGVRSAKLGGMPAGTQLALISNADIRAWAREQWPEEYNEMVGSLWDQNDNENYFSQMAQQLGWKPSPRMVEARARKTDWAMMYLANESRSKAIAGAAMYSRAYTSERFHVASRMDLNSAEYFAYEEQCAARARKEAKTQARPVRANFKGKGEL